jgi:hemerythrin-like domain-containing protein
LYWLKRFHDDHANLIRILNKLEGNLKDIKYGVAGVNVVWDLREFVELVNNVVIPHFREEEKSVYPRLSANANEDLRQLIESLYREHDLLYEAFDGFARALHDVDDQVEKTKRGRRIAAEIARSANSDKMEAPKNFDRIFESTSLEESLDTETLLLHGFIIIQLLGKHLEKEKKAEGLAAVVKNS